MSDDSLERLITRNRPSVPSRDTSLTSGIRDTSIPANLDTSMPISLDTSTSRYPESNNDQISPQQPELQTKQTTLRLEAGISDRIMDICKANNLSREVFIEALFTHYENDPKALQVILAEAKKRGDYRMQEANKKRAKSMMQRFS